MHGLASLNIKNKQKLKQNCKIPLLAILEYIILRLSPINFFFLLFDIKKVTNRSN